MAKKELTGKEAVRKFMQDNGRKGGIKTAERGAEYYREIGKKGALKRWGKNEENNEKTTT